MADKLYTVVSHSNHTHNVLFKDQIMSSKSFMVIGTIKTVNYICDMLNQYPELDPIPEIKVSDKCNFCDGKGKIPTTLGGWVPCPGVKCKPIM